MSTGKLTNYFGDVAILEADGVTWTTVTEQHPPVQEVFPYGTADTGARITQELVDKPLFGTLRLEPGVYPFTLRVNPTNGQYRTSIQVPNGRTFDASQAELRLIGGQPTILHPTLGTVDSRYADLITNKGMLSGPARDIHILVGCLNGQAKLQEPNDCRFDGIVLMGADDSCVIEGGDGPWTKTIEIEDRTVTVKGQVKNIRGWDGNGGSTESFYVDSFHGAGGLVVRSLEFTCDDGAVRTATGGSANSGGPVTYEDIWSHDLRSHGMTSWTNDGMTRVRVISQHNGGSGARNEHGTGHVDVDCLFIENANNGLNLKDCTYESTGTAYIRNARYPVELNYCHGATFRGQGTPNPSNGLMVKYTDPLGPSTNIDASQLATVPW